MHDFPVCLFNSAFRGCQNPINGLCVVALSALSRHGSVILNPDKVRYVRAGLEQVGGLCRVGSGRVRVVGCGIIQTTSAPSRVNTGQHNAVQSVAEISPIQPPRVRRRCAGSPGRPTDPFIVAQRHPGRDKAKWGRTSGLISGRHVRRPLQWR